jgi:hypothetical protein
MALEATRTAGALRLEHRLEKWTPLFGSNRCQNTKRDRLLASGRTRVDLATGF